MLGVENMPMQRLAVAVLELPSALGPAAESVLELVLTDRTNLPLMKLLEEVT